MRLTITTVVTVEGIETDGRPLIIRALPNVELTLPYGHAALTSCRGEAPRQEDPIPPLPSLEGDHRERAL
jgi:hypothetical protein